MSWKEFLRRLRTELSADQVTDLAAGVTYYGVLSLFPFLLFMVALASVVITPAQAEALVQELAQVAPGAVTQIVGDRIRQLGSQQNVGLLTVGALGAIWAASGGVTAVMRALNGVYDVEEGRPFWKVRLIAIGMTLGAGAIGLAAALAAVAAPALAEAVGGPVGTAILWLRLPVAGALMMLVWAVAYWLLPDVEQEFRFVSPGSVLGVAVWLLASWAFSLYVANFGSYDETYGALGGVIVLLLWMWISSVVLLFGAEVNAIVEHASEEGKRQGAKRLSDRGTEPARGEEAAGTREGEGERSRHPRGSRDLDPRRGAGGGWITPRAEARAGGHRHVAAARAPRLWVAAAFAAGLLLGRRRTI
jgi:membrane protein